MVSLKMAKLQVNMERTVREGEAQEMERRQGTLEQGKHGRGVW